MQKRHQQRGCVHRIAPLVLDGRAQLLISEIRINILHNGSRVFCIQSNGPSSERFSPKTDRSVECHPAHQARVKEVPAPTADLPDAFMWLLSILL